MRQTAIMHAAASRAPACEVRVRPLFTVTTVARRSMSLPDAVLPRLLLGGRAASRCRPLAEAFRTQPRLLKAGRLRTRRCSERNAGDVNDASGFSPFPGNINQLVVKLDTYVRQLEETGGVIAEFVNPKFKDATRAAFKKPARLECMMQDYPKALPATATVGFTTIKEVWATYMPVKNSPAEARAKAAQNAPTHSATHSEFSMYDAWGRLLRAAGATVTAGARATFNGLDVTMCPFISFAPSFICALSELRERFPQPARVMLSQRSSLVVQGDAVFEHLDVDGALVVIVAPGATLTVRSLVVRNQGWSLEAAPEGGPAEEKFRVRGFKMQKRAGLLLHVRAGAVVVDSVEDRPGARIFSPQECREEWRPPC